MSEVKTKPTKESVHSFINSFESSEKRNDCFAILKMMQEITGEEPRMWGSSIIGFGQYHYQYKSGREGNWPLTGFSPRKNTLSLYLMNGLKHYEAQLAELGRHKTGKACLYIKNLSDINQSVLEEMIRSSVEYMKQKYPS